MKKVCLFVLLILFFFSTLAFSEVKNDDDLFKILTNYKTIKDKWSPDPNVKIVKMIFLKKSSDEWTDTWEVETTLKSCYKMNASCTIDGYFEYSDDYYYDQRDVWGLFFGDIDKQSIRTGFKTPIKIRKEKEKYVDLFKIRITCDPIYSEHSNSHAPADKYWKQFAPGKCE